MAPSSLRALPAPVLPILSSLSQRCRWEGAAALGDEELLTLLWREDRAKGSTKMFAEDLLAAGHGLASLLWEGPWAQSDDPHGPLRRLDPVQRLRFEVALELGRRALRREALGAIGHFPNAQEVAVWAHAQLGGLAHEEIWILALDARHGLLAARQVAVGGLTGCMTSAREILRLALRLGAAAFLLVHNHPSGDPTPSAEDARMTRDVGRAAAVVGVPLLDHVVVGGGTYASLFDLGLIDAPGPSRLRSPPPRARGTPATIRHV